MTEEKYERLTGWRVLVMSFSIYALMMWVELHGGMFGGGA
jgi:hypothetical protein